jgi:hypothetical protein
MDGSFANSAPESVPPIINSFVAAWMAQIGHGRARNAKTGSLAAPNSAKADPSPRRALFRTLGAMDAY